MKKVYAIVALSLAALVSACGGSTQEEIVIVEPAPVFAEPVSRGKY